MLKVADSDKFIKEVKRFRAKNKLVKEPLRKNKVEQLICDLENLVKQIDDYHHPRYNGNIRPSSLQEKRIRVNTIRSEISKILNQGLNQT